MLAVGGPLAITTAATTTASPLFTSTAGLTTTAAVSPHANVSSEPFLRSLLPHSSPLLEGGVRGNHSLDVPQGDQPPVPPIKEGRPYRPDHWDWSTYRLLYVKNRYGKYLEMWPDGSTHGVSENNSSCVFVLMSHFVNVVMKGFISDRFLCMNNTSYHLYTRSTVHEDCYIQEAMRNGSGHTVYNFAHCRTPEGKKCYLGMYRNGTMRLGKDARQSQNNAQWMSIPVSREDKQTARDDKERLEKQGGWSPPPRPVFTTPRPVSPREQRRKRVRRWCRNLDVIVKRPYKYVTRCKHDCDVLKKMIDNPERYMRRCLQHHVRRRLLKKARDSGSPLDSAKIRALVQSLWPKREEIFQRLRQLRRCNKKLRRRRKDGKKQSCSRRELQRHLRVRAQRRRQTKAETPASPTSPTRSTSRSRSGRKRIRHRRKKLGRERGRGARAKKTAQPEVRRQKRRSGPGVLWTVLTSR